MQFNSREHQGEGKIKDFREKEKKQSTKEKNNQPKKKENNQPKKKTINQGVAFFLSVRKKDGRRMVREGKD